MQMPESDGKSAACHHFVYADLTCNVSSPGRDVTLNCTMSKEEISFFFFPQAFCVLFTVPKTLQDFTEPQEAECLFMEIWYACVCFAYSFFSSIFCLPGIFPRMCLPSHKLHFSRNSFHRAPETIVMHLTWAQGYIWSNSITFFFPIAVTRSHHYLESPWAAIKIMRCWAMNHI